MLAEFYANLMEMVVVMEYAACIVYHNQQKMLRMYACFQPFVFYYLLCTFMIWEWEVSWLCVAPNYNVDGRNICDKIVSAQGSVFTDKTGLCSSNR